jgi:hypothetical protein
MLWQSSVTNVDIRFAWLKIIHQRNMSSRTNGIPLFEKGVARQFGLQAKDLPQSLPAAMIFVIFRLLSRIKRKFIKP